MCGCCGSILAMLSDGRWLCNSCPISICACCCCCCWICCCCMARRLLAIMSGIAFVPVRVVFCNDYTANALPAGALAINLASCSCTSAFMSPDCCVPVEITGAAALTVTVVADRLVCACIVAVCLLYKYSVSSEDSTPDGAHIKKLMANRL